MTNSRRGGPDSAPGFSKPALIVITPILVGLSSLICALVLDFTNDSTRLADIFRTVGFTSLLSYVGYVTLSVGQYMRSSDVLSQVARIQTLGQDLIGFENNSGNSGEALSSGSKMSLFKLRSDLVRLGYWTTSDLEKFDSALRVRNSIAHADDNLSRKEVKAADANSRELVARLQEQLASVAKDSAIPSGEDS